MPAVDPQRLERQISELLRHFGDPALLAKHTQELLEFHADRARRSTAAYRVGTRAYRVAGPVMRAMRRRFAATAAGQPESALPAARALWDTEWKEAQLLAAGILGALEDERVVPLIERWSLTSRDRAVVSALAETALEGWRRAEPTAYLNQLRRWLRSTKEAKRTLALQALRFSVADPSFEAIPFVLESIERLSQRVRGESRRALRRLIHALAERSPAETARFLQDEAARGVQGIDQLIRDTWEAFPAAQAASLRASLSAHRGAGIMRQS